MIFFQKISYIVSIWRPSKFGAQRARAPRALPPRYATGSGRGGGTVNFSY